LFFVIFIVVVLFFQENLISNFFLSLSSKAYYIPKESNFFSFKVLKQNSGSGEWWLYAEDSNNYYAISDENHYSYLILNKKHTPDHFDTLDKSTWGNDARVGLHEN